MALVCTYIYACLGGGGRTKLVVGIYKLYSKAVTEKKPAEVGTEKRETKRIDNNNKTDT